MKKKKFFSNLHKTFGSAGLVWLIIFLAVFGGIGGLIINRLFLPYLAQISLIDDVSVLQPDAPYVINRRQEVVIEDGINQQEVANRVRDSLVLVYEHQGEFNSGDFRVLNAFSGIVMTNDGLIAVPEGLLSSGANYTVISEKFMADGEIVARDVFSGVGFLKVDEEDLSIPRQGFSQEVSPAEKLLLVRMQERGSGPSVRPIVATNSNQLEPSLLNNYRLDELNRSLLVDGEFSDSELGGGVFDRDGQLLGMVLSPRDAVQIVLVQDLQLVLDNFLEDGEIIWPQLNLTYQIFGPTQARVFDLPHERGVLLKSSYGQLLSDDFVYEVDGVSITEQLGFQELLYRAKSGQTLTLKLIRDGEEKIARLQL